MIDGRKFLDLAQQLAVGTTEAEWRTAVSRAYYGAFHEARRLLRGLGFVVPRAERAHAHLWLRLSNCSVAQIELAGADLNRLRRERNTADYDVERTLHRIDAALHVQNARRLAQALDAAHVEPTRTRITDAMKIYERDVLKDETWQP